MFLGFFFSIVGQQHENTPFSQNRENGGGGGFLAFLGVLVV